MSAIDGIRGEWNGFGDGVGVCGRNQRGSGVENDNIAARGTFSVEHGANDGSILLRGVASGDFGERRGVEAEFFGCDFVGADPTIADFGDLGRSGDGDFIETIATVDD